MKKFKSTLVVTVFSIISVIATGCSSQQKATSADSINTSKATIPDTSRSPVTHMDTSKKPPR